MLKILIFCISCLFSIQSVYSCSKNAWKDNKKILKNLALNSQKDILCDIGAGNGDLSITATNFVKHVFAIEVDEKQITRIAEKIRGSAIKNLTPVLARYDHPLIPDKSCDVILMVATYHHIKDRIKYLKTLAPLLKENGRIVNIDNTDELSKYKNSSKRIPSASCRFSKRRFIKEAKAAGFVVVKSHDFLGSRYFLELKPLSKTQN